MPLRSAFALPLTICFTAGIGHSQSTAAFLATLDRFSQTFKGASAALHTISHVKGVPEDDVQTGNFLMRRSGSGAEMRIDFKQPNEYTALMNGLSAQVYRPKINEIDLYDIRQYKDAAQKLQLLGFGMAGKELAANYQIRNLKSVPMDGQASTYLELIPKSPDVLKVFTSIEIWISDATLCPVRQTFHLPDSGFYNAQYSNLTVNPKFPSGAFDLPKNAKRVKAN